jgi:hypothetical protein
MKEMYYNYSNKMFSYLKDQADPDNQRPDNWTYRLLYFQPTDMLNSHHHLQHTLTHKYASTPKLPNL